MVGNDTPDDSRESADDAAEMRENATAAQRTISNDLRSPILLTSTTSTPSTQDKSDGGSRRGYVLPLFVANMSLLILFYMTMMIYGGGVVRTLERRFGLRSAQTGLMQSANDVLHVCIVVFIGYFGRKGHKPRIMCVTVLFSAFAGFMMASPHFFMSASYDDPVQIRLVSAINGSSPLSETSNLFCRNWNTSGTAISGDQCDQLEQGSTQAAVHPAYYVFLTAQFISGIGGSGIHTLSLAYIDENAPGSKSSFYIGIVTSLYAFGPLGGMMLAAFTLGLPENLLSPVKVSPSDPSWFGCWWLGYVICATGLLATSIPLWFFPKSFSKKVADVNQKEATEPAQKSLKEETALSIAQQEIKEFPRRLLHLLRNKAYVVNLLSVVCGGYIILGVYVNLVRYIEIHFLERAFIGSLIAGLGCSLVGALGVFLGGLVMSRLKIRPRGAVKIIICTEVVFTTGIVIVLFLGCPQLQMAGQIDPVDHRFSVITDCNKHCACSTSRKSYAPVCGSDNLTYFSACTAGCMSYVNGSYSDCACIGSDGREGGGSGRGGGGGGTGGGTGEGGWALPGLCRPTCNLLIPFAFTLLIMSFFGSVARVPSTIVNFRIVDDDERAFALSINSFAINLFAFVPAPLLYGSLIDSACILWQTTCKKTGVCLLFNTERFRFVIYGVALVFEVIDLLLAILLFLLVRKMVFHVADTDRKKNRLGSVGEVQKENEDTKETSIYTIVQKFGNTE